MSTGSCRLAAVGRLALATLAAFTIATPASAQLGGLRKKIKPTANQEGAAPGDQGGMIVLTEEVVGQLLAGLRAGQAERAAAAKEDTPYGLYKKEETAYAAAQIKCEAGQRTFTQRSVDNPKMLDKYGALTEKMVEAQGKGDMKLMSIYQDSAMAMQDPACVVKKPEQPKDYYEAERAIEGRAEEKEMKASGFNRGELAIIKERTSAILQGAPAPGGASPMEKSAVSARASELKPLLGFREQPAPVAKKAPEPAPAPAPVAQPSPEMSAAASSMSACMTKNVQTNQAKIEALGKRAQTAQAAGNTQQLMAIADTIQQIQMAGCQGR